MKQLLFIAGLCASLPAIAQQGQPQMPQSGYNVAQYIAAHTHYPDGERSYGTEGKVIVKFAIDTDGTITDYTIIKSISSACDAEALRVIKNMPRWKPGMQNGKPVKVGFALPVVFKPE